MLYPDISMLPRNIRLRSMQPLNLTLLKAEYGLLLQYAVAPLNIFRISELIPRIFRSVTIDAYPVGIDWKLNQMSRMRSNRVQWKDLDPWSCEFFIVAQRLHFNCYAWGQTF